MNQFIEEIKEDVRRDQVIQFLRQYGNQIIGAILFLIVVFGGYYGWQSYKKTIHLKDAEIYMQALQFHEDKQTDEALVLLKKLEDHSKTAYKSMAMLVRARLVGDHKNKNEARAVLESLAKDPKANREFRHLSALLIALGTISSDNAKDISEQLVKETIVTNPWAQLAREVIAYGKYLSGDLNAAKEDFQSLQKDFRATEGIKARAHAMIGVMNYTSTGK